MFGETEFHPDRCYASAPLEEQLEALAGAQHAGLIRHYGLSNETPWGLMEACRLGMLSTLLIPELSAPSPCQTTGCWEFCITLCSHIPH